MQNTNTSDQQMTDVFQAAQQKLETKPGLPKSNIGKNKKAILTTAAILLSGSAFTAIALKGDKPVPPKGESIPLESTPTDIPIGTHQVPHGTITPAQNIDISQRVTNDMSFDQAYASAREEVGPGGVFWWHGNVYNTYTVEEWQGLSLAQRQEFLSDVGFKPTQNIESTNSQTNDLPVLEPDYVETTINGRPALGIDDDHDGVVDAIVMMGVDNNSIVAIIDAEGDNRLDTVLKIDMNTQEIVTAEPLDEPVLTGMAQLEAMNENSAAVSDTHLVTLPEEETSEIADEEATDDGYDNDANMDDMAG